MTLGAVPTLKSWTLNPDNSVTGTVTGHPSIPDGEVITTSVLIEVPEGRVRKVATVTGSVYRLSEPAAAAKEKEKEKGAPKLEIKGTLTTQTVGSDKRRYAVVKGTTRTSPSGKSRLSTAYRLDREGNADAGPYLIKASENVEALTREAKNYGRVNGIMPKLGRLAILSPSTPFVRMIDHVKKASGDGGYSQKEEESVIALELAPGGDLKSFIKKRPLSGAMLRDALASIVLCVKSVHDAGLVWTDLKVENVVVVDPGNYDDDGYKRMVVKGIDLESAVKVNTNPVDYSPEACPPEFARAFVQDGGETFLVKKSYDSWSLGMVMYNIATGRGYFEGRTAAATTKILATPGFAADFSAIDDDGLRDLIKSLCNSDESKRIGVGRTLFHPYFTGSGLGVWTKRL